MEVLYDIADRMREQREVSTTQELQEYRPEIYPDQDYNQGDDEVDDGSIGDREPRKPLPNSGSGSVELELP